MAKELNLFLQRLKIAHENLNKANLEAHVLIKSEDLNGETENIAEYQNRAISTVKRLTHRLGKIRRM